MADDNRGDLIYGKDKLLAPLQPGMQHLRTRWPGACDRRELPGQATGRSGNDEVHRNEEVTHVLAAATLTRTSTPEAVAFWVLGVIAVVGAVGVVAAPRRSTPRSSWPPP